jgi:hypothetical protein
MTHPLDTKALEAAAIHLCAAIDNLWNHPDLRRIREEIPESIKLNISKGQMMTRTALAASGDGWMPIESAPKDGTRVLLAMRETGDKGPNTDTVIGSFVVWSGQMKREGMRDGWSWYGAAFMEPTHWRPLPAPPAQEPST